MKREAIIEKNPLNSKDWFQLPIPNEYIRHKQSKHKKERHVIQLEVYNK